MKQEQIYLAICEDLELTQWAIVQQVTDIERHQKETEIATGGNIEFTYVPLNAAKQASELIQKIESLIASFISRCPEAEKESIAIQNARNLLAKLR